MRTEEQARLLQNELETILGGSGVTVGLKELVLRSLSCPGRAFSSGIGFCWPMMSLLACEASGGDSNKAMPAAAALELWLAAGDVFDDLEDRDSGGLWEAYGEAQAANVGTALVFLSQIAAHRLRREHDASLVMRVIGEISRAGVISCSGQHCDLANESRNDITEEDYFRMTGMRSGSLLDCVCRVGALLGTNDEQVIEAFGTFGYSLGIYCQVRNDVRSLRCANGKTDIVRRKKTLPVLFGLDQADVNGRKLLREVFFGQATVDAGMADLVLQVLHRAGAVGYCMVVAETYRERALSALAAVGIRGDRLLSSVAEPGGLMVGR